MAPLALKLWRQRWYLLAQDRKEESADFYQSLRVFSLNRIKDIALTEQSYKMPPEFSPQAYFNDYYGVLTNHNAKVEHIVLRAYGQTPHYLRDLPLHQSQREIESTAEYTDFELFLKPTPDFLSHLFTHGTGVRVMSPSHLAEEMKSRLENMLKTYEI